MTISAALYARTAVSDAAHSIDEQVTRLRTYVAAQGWTLADEHVFQDDGISGLVFERPGLDAMIDALQAGEFVRLVVLDPDRLSRSAADLWLIENLAARLGCQIVFVDARPGVTPTGAEAAALLRRAAEGLALAG